MHMHTARMQKVRGTMHEKGSSRVVKKWQTNNNTKVQLKIRFHLHSLNRHTFCVVFTKRILFVEKSFFENTPVRRMVEGCLSVQQNKTKKKDEKLCIAEKKQMSVKQK